MTAATVAQLRLLLNDPSDSDPLLTDAQYTTLIALESNVYRAAALGARTIAALFAQKVKWSAGQLSLDNQQKFNHYMTLSDSYDSRAKQGGGVDGGILTPLLEGVSEDRMETIREDDDIVQPSFRMELMDNPPLGSTDESDDYLYNE